MPRCSSDCDAKIQFGTCDEVGFCSSQVGSITLSPDNLLELAAIESLLDLLLRYHIQRSTSLYNRFEPMEIVELSDWFFPNVGPL